MDINKDRNDLVTEEIFRSWEIKMASWREKRQMKFVSTTQKEIVIDVQFVSMNHVTTVTICG